MRAGADGCKWRVRLACLSTVLLFVVAFIYGYPALSHAAIQGEDYVGNTMVTDRGLNITEAPAVDAKYGIVCDSQGNVLWSRGANERSAMASITKVMTAVVALENADLNTEYTVSSKAASVGESSAGLSEGEKIPLSELVKGLLVHSGNDASMAIAEGVGGSEDAFVSMMNEKAQQMGLSNTQFKNPHGLDQKGHYSSAADISVVVRYAMNNETFREIVANDTTTLNYGGQSREYMTTNALLACWKPCIGVKTGYTSDAGQCLASAATRNDVTLYAVVLGCSDEVQRFTDSYKLLTWGFAHYRQYQLASSNDVLVDVPLSGYLNRTVRAGVQEDMSALVLDYDGDISVDVKLVDVSDGVDEGDEVGSITWRQGEVVVATAPLVAKEHIGSPMPWTSVATAAVRLLGVLTGDSGVAQSNLYAQTISIERDSSSAGQQVSTKMDKKLRAYVAEYNASLYG